MSLWRCSVLRWRELVVGAGVAQENLRPEPTARQVGVNCPWAATGRTRGGRNHSGQSTAGCRGGPARMSVEGLVMRLEQRGRAGRLVRRPTRWWGRS